jgi:hypothetical protein
MGSEAGISMQQSIRSFAFVSWAKARRLDQCVQMKMNKILTAQVGMLTLLITPPQEAGILQRVNYAISFYKKIAWILACLV